MERIKLRERPPLLMAIPKLPLPVRPSLLQQRAIMRILVNDEPRDVAEAATLATFMHSLQLPSFDGVAVACNETVVPRDRWEAHSLHESDRLIIIHATQGG